MTTTPTTTETGSELAVIDHREQHSLSQTSPAAMRARAGAVAAAVRDIVLVCTQNIQGKRYVKVEGWQAIANTYGCVAYAEGVEKIEGGWVAHAKVIHLETGREVGKGEGFVGEDEKMWMSRPLFARRAMAQTRAIGRACRSAFAFLLPMIDAGLSTTPAEEMSHVEEEQPAERIDTRTGEVLPATTGTLGASLEEAEQRIRTATTKDEAYKTLQSLPPAAQKRLAPIYREQWGRA